MDNTSLYHSFAFWRFYSLVKPSLCFPSCITGCWEGVPSDRIMLDTRRSVNSNVPCNPLMLTTFWQIYSASVPAGNATLKLLNEMFGQGAFVLQARSTTKYKYVCTIVSSNVATIILDVSLEMNGTSIPWEQVVFYSRSFVLAVPDQSSKDRSLSCRNEGTSVLTEIGQRFRWVIHKKGYATHELPPFVWYKWTGNVTSCSTKRRETTFFTMPESNGDLFTIRQFSPLLEIQITHLCRRLHL